MIDPAGKRSMSAMEELQAIARSNAHMENMAHRCAGSMVEDFALWEREMQTDVPQDAIEYMEGE